MLPGLGSKGPPDQRCRRRWVFLFRRVRWNDSNRGALAKQGRLTWLRNLIQPRSTSILKIPRKRPRPTARWTEILWPVWLAHFRRQTRSAPRSREARVHADRFSGKKKRPRRGELRPLKVICVSLVWQRRKINEADQSPFRFLE